jgi:hypothetical protein
MSKPESHHDRRRGRNTLAGGGLRDFMTANGGNHNLSGLGANDVLDAGAGGEVINGGLGGDVMRAGNDALGYVFVHAGSPIPASSRPRSTRSSNSVLAPMGTPPTSEKLDLPRRSLPAAAANAVRLFISPAPSSHFA